MMSRTERRKKTKNEIIPRVNAMLAEMEKGNSSESEVRIHNADGMWVLRLELTRTV